MAARLSGVSPVLEVPFTADGEIDVDSFAHLAHHVLGTGVGSVLFPAFASEFYKLTDDERETLSDELYRVATHHPGVTVIGSVPDHATRVAVARATRAVEAGAPSPALRCRLACTSATVAGRPSR